MNYFFKPICFWND